MIYTADCPVFKDDGGELLTKPYTIDFITSPAPNYGAVARQQTDSLAQLEGAFIQRIRAVLTLAVQQGCDALVLGAWGCGVFANSPQSVAGWFADELTGEGEFARSFRYITFSIPENSRTAENTISFQRAFTK